MAVYLLCATQPLPRGQVYVRHYLGYAAERDLAGRVRQHQAGRSDVAIVRAFRTAGAALLLVRVWPGADRTFERKLKRGGHAAALCPLCNPPPVDPAAHKELPKWQTYPPNQSQPPMRGALPKDHCRTAAA